MTGQGPSGNGVVEFSVFVRRGSGGVEIEVTDQHDGEFANVYAGDLDTALSMALPYMLATAEPDPFDFVGRLAASMERNAEVLDRLKSSEGALSPPRASGQATPASPPAPSEELRRVQKKCERLRNEVRDLTQAKSLAENAKLRRERDEYCKSLSNLRYRLLFADEDLDKETLLSITSVLDRVKDWS